MWTRVSLSLLLVVLVCSGAAAQTNVGQIAGTVRDASGAVLPGVSVTVTNTNTGLSRTEVTGPSGGYVVTNLPIGTYSVTAELQGFRKVQRTGFELTADGRITADFTLAVGALTETVDVVAVRSEVVNRTSGEMARLIDGDQVRELSLSGRNYLELTSLIPGAVQLETDQMNVTTSLSTTGTVINGARGNSNSLMVDGGFNLDSGSNASQINNVGLDFIDQVAIQTSNFSAEYGRNAGAAINVVTRSGSNYFRKSLFETFRDESLDMPNHFTPRDANGKAIKGQLNFHDFGGTIGGPIRRGRLFFFTGLEFKKLNRVDGPFRRTMPTLAELNGDFTARMAGADGIVGTADDSSVTNTLTDPVTRLPLDGTIIPPDRITADGRAIARVYGRMLREALQVSDTPTGNNATFQLPFPFDWRQEMVRLDFRPAARHNLAFRYLHDDYDLVEPRGTFIGADLPTIPTRRLRPGYSLQGSHTFVIRQNLLNELKLNTSWNSQRIPPEGDVWQRDQYGFAFPQVYSGGPYDDGIPDVSITGFASLTGPSQSLYSPTTDITAQNTLTWLKRAHSVRSGVIVTRNRKDQNGRANHTGSASFSTAGNTNTTGLALADMLLGNFRTYTEAADDPLGYYRFTQFGVYTTDTWRVRSNISLEMGLRYELASPTYSQQNNLVNFDPALYDAAKAVTLLRDGSVVLGSGNPYIGLIRGGDGIPANFQNRVTVDQQAAALIPTGAARGLYDTHHLIMPRFSGAYSITKGTVVRGGVGLFYDKPEGNVIYSQVNLPPFLPTISVENGNLANPLGGRPSAAAVLGTVNAIDPRLQIPRQLNFSISAQRELPHGMFAEVAYVGNRGRHLLWQPEINNASFDDLIANAALPTAQRANTNYLRPYKGYSSIRQRRSNAFADYNGLQLYLNRRKGTLKYSVSYTYSKATGNASGNGDNPEDAFNFEFNTGPTSYDRRHVLVTTWTYVVPAFRNRRDLVGWTLGGWELSGKTRWQTGQYLTPTGNTSTGTRRADYVGGPIDLSGDERTQNRWFNTDAFVTAPDTRRGNALVGMIEGPGLYTWDISIRKYFSLAAAAPGQQQKRIGLRADMFNALNQVNYSNPNTTVTSGSYGQISDSRPPRQVQLSLRFEF